jgi:hypothetical protein
VFTLEGVLADLARGQKFCTGGGRFNYTFSWIDGKLNRHMFDEGLDVDEIVGDKELAEAIGSADFRRW